MNSIGTVPNPAAGLPLNLGNQAPGVEYVGQAFPGVTYNAGPGQANLPPQVPHVGPPAGHAALYVGDLHPDVSEAMLFDRFSQFGPVSSIKICRDYMSRKSLNYGYVNFLNIDDAEKAIDHLNFEELMGKQMRIMWSQRDPALRKSGQGNLFIKNLDREIKNRELYDTFSVFGDILSCKIATDENAVSKGYGFVHFKSAMKASEAIKKLDGMVIKEKKVSVVPFIPRVERQKMGMGAVRFNNVFVKNFSEDYDDEKLKALFQRFGPITSVKVEKNDQSLAKGFGFVCFEKYEDAKEAVETMNNFELTPAGKVLYVGRAQKKTERTEILKNVYEKKKQEKLSSYSAGVNLYVKNLDDNVDDAALLEAFVEHGPITSAKVMTDPTGISKGFGFVCFSVREDAATAVTEMNGKLVKGKPLYVALAQRKEERRMQLASTFNQRTMSGQRMMNYQQMAGVPNLMNASHMQGFNAPLTAALFGGVGNSVNHRPGYQMQNLAFSQQRPRWAAQMANYRPPAQQVMQAVQSPYRTGHPGYLRMPSGVSGLSPSGGPSRAMMGPAQSVPRSAARMPPVQYTNQARNVQRPTGAGDGPAQQLPAGLTKEYFLNAVGQNQNEDGRRQAIGESIYTILMPILQGWNQSNLCGKVTGMLLQGHGLDDLAEMVSSHLDTPVANSVLLVRLRANMEALSKQAVVAEAASHGQNE